MTHPGPSVPSFIETLIFEVRSSFPARRSAVVTVSPPSRLDRQLQAKVSQPDLKIEPSLAYPRMRSPERSDPLFSSALIYLFQNKLLL